METSASIGSHVNNSSPFERKLLQDSCQQEGDNCVISCCAGSEPPLGTRAARRTSTRTARVLRCYAYTMYKTRCEPRFDFAAATRTSASDPAPHPSLLLTTQKLERQILSSRVLYRESSPSKTEDFAAEMVLPLSLVGLISFTRRDEVNECSDEACIHLEQVDSLEALRRLGVVRAMLHRIVCHYTMVTRITLCVSSRNSIAQAAYRKLEFSGFDRLPEGDNLLAVLEEAAIKRLRAGPAPSSSLPSLSFTSLGGGEEGSRAELNEVTMSGSCDLAAAAAKPSRELAFSTMGLGLCAANLSKRYLLEHGIVKTPSECELEALSLITGSGTSEAVDCIGALLPRVEVQLAQVSSQLGLGLGLGLGTKVLQPQPQS